MLSALLSLLLLAGIQIHHWQVPVVTGQDIAVASVTMPEGAEPTWNIKAKGLPCKALKSAFVKDGYLWVNISPKASSLDKPFTLVIKADGYEITESGIREHRLARRVRSGGDDGVAAYRIPGLITSKKGTLVATYDIRHNSAYDLQEDIDIGISRSTDGGKTWGPMIVAMDMGEFGGLPQNVNGIGDPCILLDEVTGDILLFAAWTHGGSPGRAAWWTAGDGFEPADTPQLMMSRSSDDGLTWSTPVNLTRQIKRQEWHFTFQGPGRGITMADGTLVVPFQHQEADRTPAAGVMYSRDRGATWTVHEYAKINTTESQVVEVEPGVLMLNMRDNRKTGRAVHITKDMGRTWEAHSSDGKLVEPVCMASIIKVPASQNALGQDILLFSNPSDGQDRRNMTIQMSLDGGVTWTRSLLIDQGYSWGYSCLSMIDKNTVGILYESSQAHMTFQAVKLKDIK
ncbi:MAG: exo-alpha-sialidase [Bacteroidales bacterium]|nr:exo-alpha-sialidase [Bacteroidales bacterium]